MVSHTFALHRHALQCLDSFCFGKASYNIVESRFGMYGQLVIVCHIPTACLRGVAGQVSHGLPQFNVWWRISHANIYPKQAVQASAGLMRPLCAGARRCASHHLHRRD